MVFKNQYILCKKGIVPKTKYNKIKIGEYNLYISSEIKYYTANNNKVILLGYVFHCYNNKSEKELIENIFSLNNAELLDEIDKWCGHFVLFKNNDSIKVYTDACASFKVFYAESEGEKVIASDPKTLNKFFSFKIDKNKEKEIFYNSNYFLNDNTKVGHHTRYKNMYQLVSNYSLDLNSFESTRIFPREKRKEETQKETSKQLIPIFRNILQQIEKRFVIYASITAGYDSRLLMAATKILSEQVQYYTFTLANKSDDFIDYTLPKKMTSELGLKYKLVNIDELNEGVKEEIFNTYDLPKISPFQQYKDIFPNTEKENILLVGFVSEVAKNYLERVPVKNGKDVVRAVHSPDNKYLENYYQKWLNKNKKTIDQFGYEVLDFIHWEQDITNFAGQNTYYAHHYVNLFSIFNSREIIRIMLAVKPEKRDGKDTQFFRYLIQKMWPELLNYPFNPTIKERIIILMKKIRIYPLYKYLQVKFYKNGKII